MSKITSVVAREILDSRGNPTVEVCCTLHDGSFGIFSVPSGASTGVHEALELRDHDEKRYGGLGVLFAVSNVNTEINQFLQGNGGAEKEWEQKSLDEALVKLDGTENKSRLGANAILGVSLAFARAVAQQRGVELFEHLGGLAQNSNFKLPQPMFNVINGGKHVAAGGLDLQEFMLAPVGFDTCKRKIQAAAEIISALKKILETKGYAVSVGDEGGFAPQLSSNEEAFELMEQAILAAGYTFDQVKIAIDAAASTFYKDGFYNIRINGTLTKNTSTEIIAWYESLVQKHPIISIEDGLAEDDWEGFSEMNARLGGKITIVGDDLTVTNTKRIQQAIDVKAINSVLIKPNQIGTLTETIAAINLTKKQGWIPFVSHRSGETTDTFIADLAVGLCCDFIKSGSLARGERVAKYDRLMEIEEGLGGN